MKGEDAETQNAKVGFDNQGNVIVKNRAYRRRWKNRAMMEGRPKKYYTTKMTKKQKKTKLLER